MDSEANVAFFNAPFLSFRLVMTKPEKTPEKEKGHQQAKEQPKEDKPSVDLNVVVIPINSH